MRKINEIDVLGKTVIVRVDFNCPVQDGKITSDVRIKSHAGTIRNLAFRGAKVVVLSHQGRLGRDDFIGLEQHSKILAQILEREIKYVDQVVGEKAFNAISSLKNGEIVVLDNVRHLKCETCNLDGMGELVKKVGPLADYYVLDALSVAHRTHSSVIGFSKIMPCFAGQILADELEAVDIIKAGHDVTFVLGGSKIEDSFSIMENWLKNGRAREAIVCGALSILLLHASGKKIGDSIHYLEEKGYLEHIEKAKEIINKYQSKILLPIDVGLNIDGKRVECDIENIETGKIFDIGDKTIYEYVKQIMNSKYVVANGPAGVYEEPEFAKGTQRIMEAVSRTKAYTLLGGGHTIASLDKFGIDKHNFNYVSLSGKALIAYLCGFELPGIKALIDNQEKFPKL